MCIKECFQQDLSDECHRCVTVLTVPALHRQVMLSLMPMLHGFLFAFRTLKPNLQALFVASAGQAGFSSASDNRPVLRPGKKRRLHRLYFS